MIQRFKNIEAEREVIAGAITNEDFLSEIAEAITPEYFTDKACQNIYVAVLKIFQSGGKITIVSIIETLKSYKISISVSQLMEYTKPYSSHASCIEASKIMVENFQRNQLTETMNQLSKELETKKPLQIAESLSEAVDKVYKGDAKRHEISDEESISELLQDLEETMATGKITKGLTTGWFQMDLSTNGFQKGDLVVIGARPSIGKTSFALNLNRKFNYRQEKGLIFSLEMSHKKLMIRRVAMNAGLDINSMRFGKLSDEETKRFSMIVNKLAQENRTYVDDSAGITVKEIRRRAKKAKQKYDIGYIIIDHVNIIKAPTGSSSRTEAVTNISMELKAIAKDLDIVVFALSQLSRTSEHTAEKAPQLHHLRESGALEQDADIVILLHRDRAQQQDNVVVDLQVDIAKNRDGRTGIIEFDFNLVRQIIEEKPVGGIL